MLHVETVSASTLELLKSICSIEQLQDFGLVGGTNLALRYGHRISVDLDFFTNVSFEPNDIVRLVEKKFRHYELVFQRNQTLVFEIEQVRVDFVLYPFPWINPFDKTEAIRLVSIADIIPMKLQGMENRKSKKDFWDLACLLDHYSLQYMMETMKKKFPFVDIGFLIHALTHFEDAELQPDPLALNNWDWEYVKDRLQNAAVGFTKTFLKR